MLPLWTRVRLLRLWRTAYSTRRADQAHGSRLAHWFNAEPDLVAGFGAETDLLKGCGKFALKELKQFPSFGTAGLVIDACIDVFRVLPENHHFHLFRMFYRGRHAL